MVRGFFSPANLLLIFCQSWFSGLVGKIDQLWEVNLLYLIRPQFTRDCINNLIQDELFLSLGTIWDRQGAVVIFFTN